MKILITFGFFDFYEFLVQFLKFWLKLSIWMCFQGISWNVGESKFGIPDVAQKFLKSKPVGHSVIENWILNPGDFEALKRSKMSPTDRGGQIRCS